MWTLVETDLHEHFGIDVYDSQLMRSRPWRWLEARIIALIAVENGRVRNWFFPPKQPKVSSNSTTTGR